MGGRVAAQLALVARRGEQLAVAQERRADRHVAVLLRPARLAPGPAPCRARAPPRSCSGTSVRRLAIDGGVSRLELRCGQACSKWDRQCNSMRIKLALGAAMAALLALLGASAAAGCRGVGDRPAPPFAPRQLVVKFDGEAHGRTIGLPRGAGVLATARALRAKPNVEYAVPNYAAHASAVEPEPFDPDDAARSKRSPAAPSPPPAAGRPASGTSSTTAARRPRSCRSPPAGSTRSAPGRTSKRRAGPAARASSSPSSTAASPTATTAPSTCAAPTSRRNSSSPAKTSSTTTTCRSTRTATAPTSPARSPSRPTTGSASPASPTAPS